MPSLLDKIWEAHVVERSPGQPDLLYIDRHLVHEVTSPQAFEALRLAGRKIRRPDLTLAVMDHSVPTCDRSRPLKDPVAEAQVAFIEKNAAEFGFTLFGLDDPRQGVIHVTMPEQGYILPGYQLAVDLENQTVQGNDGFEASFDYDPFRKEMILYFDKYGPAGVRPAARGRPSNIKLFVIY